MGHSPERVLFGSLVAQISEAHGRPRGTHNLVDESKRRLWQDAVANLLDAFQMRELPFQLRSLPLRLASLVFEIPCSFLDPLCPRGTTQVV